jgi:hypothetical protein
VQSALRTVFHTGRISTTKVAVDRQPGRLIQGYTPQGAFQAKPAADAFLIINGNPPGLFIFFDGTHRTEFQTYGLLALVAKKGSTSEVLLIIKKPDKGITASTDLFVAEGAGYLAVVAAGALLRVVHKHLWHVTSSLFWVFHEVEILNNVLQLLYILG